MAEIRPFRALRFNTEKAGEIGQLVCPPYDIISDEQRKGYLAKNPCNIITDITGNCVHIFYFYIYLILFLSCF